MEIKLRMTAVDGEEEEEEGGGDVEGLQKSYRLMRISFYVLLISI